MFIFQSLETQYNYPRQVINQAYLRDEILCVKQLLSDIDITPAIKHQIDALAKQLVLAVRSQKHTESGLNAFLQEYDLSSKEGVVLLCLAEALLRIPDPRTADKLIKDKLTNADWEKHLGQSHSLFVNASTWGLMLTGRIARQEAFQSEAPFMLVNDLINRVSEPVVRASIREAMRIMGNQFVMGSTITQALERSRLSDNQNNLYSYDMLGEAALCEQDVRYYFDAYMAAMNAIEVNRLTHHDVRLAPSISIKLSALHPRLELAQRDRILKELVPRMCDLASKASELNIGLTIDAEEADRLDLSLDIFEALILQPNLRQWQGLGIVVQAYQKRAPYVIDWLMKVAKENQRCIMLRLVKGAYWDSEIKWAQERGLDGYPVFTRKEFTDISYIACAQKILQAGELFYPQFASHNARTIATIITLFKDTNNYELQRLQGMGESLYSQLRTLTTQIPRCRIYAPVGQHKDLLPYLVRRLLENGANTSFINQINDISIPVEETIIDPIDIASKAKIIPHSQIPLPSAIYGENRINSKGTNLSDSQSLEELAQSLQQYETTQYHVSSIIAGQTYEGASYLIHNPAIKDEFIGQCFMASEEQIQLALDQANEYLNSWNTTPMKERIGCLLKVADLIEVQKAELVSLCVREAGKCVADALAEVREAVDFCRYYACLANKHMSEGMELAGPTGEQNSLHFSGRGIFVCISPWNFPVAIFCGQIGAALLSGNCVIAKSSSLTPIIASRIVNIFLSAGIPKQALHLVMCSGAIFNRQVITAPGIAGVVFTGSIETAHSINRCIAQRSGPIIPLIAETGGINAMIVDSSALPQQVVADVIRSSFNSAGQRCSALRVLFIQNSIADRIIVLLKNAMEELSIGDPRFISTDIGPVIDGQAQQKLEQYIATMIARSNLIYRSVMTDKHRNGYFVAPTIFEINNIDVLKHEVFGPILHVIRYDAAHLDGVINAINATGYGLTMGIHSRIEQTVDYIQKRAKVGNIYVNRNMIGATVGVQPFGGEGLSGTGPKAGGPHYLLRFITERVVSNNRSAIGGNTALLNI